MSSTKPTIEQLTALKTELTDRINAIQVHTHHKDEPVEKDFAEQVTQSENDDVLNALDGEAQTTVILIDRAIARINDGSYGTCSNCGEKIPDARLNVLPYATTCIACTE